MHGPQAYSWLVRGKQTMLRALQRASCSETGCTPTSVFCWYLGRAVKWSKKTKQWVCVLQRLKISFTGHRVRPCDTFARGSATFLGYRAPRWRLWSRVVHSCVCGRRPGKWLRLDLRTQTTSQSKNNGETKRSTGTDQKPVQKTPLRWDSWGTRIKLDFSVCKKSGVSSSFCLNYTHGNTHCTFGQHVWLCIPAVTFTYVKCPCSVSLWLHLTLHP